MWTPETCDGCGQGANDLDIVMNKNETYFAFCGLPCLVRWMRACGYSGDGV